MNVSASRLNFIVLMITTLFLLRFFVNLFIPGHVISKKGMPGHTSKKVETHESIDNKYLIEKPHNMNDLFSAAERGDARARVACFIIIVGFIFWAIGSLFFIFEAFKISIGWGMFVLFGNGIAIFFLMRHWDRAKFPFLVYNLGICIVIAGACIAVYGYQLLAELSLQLITAYYTDFAQAHFNLGAGYLARGDRANALKEHEILKTLDTALADKLLYRINKK